jgi:hypothetical protein
MFPMRQSTHFRSQSQLGVSFQDAIRVDVQDAKYPAMSGALLTGYKTGILREARSGQLRGGFIKQTLNVKESQEFMGRSEKFKNQ